jgi:prepilin-type N-terminal cleavage/methylation domain-containing protein
VKIRDDTARATVLNVLLDERLRGCHVSLAATTRADALGLPNRRGSSPLSDRAAWSGRYRISHPSTLMTLLALHTRTHGSLRSRRAFSLIEMMVVLVIAGITMAIAMPKFAGMRDRMSVRSAKQQFSSYLATARAAAIRQSQLGHFHANNNTIWSNVNQPDGTNINVSRGVSLMNARGVAVTLGGSAPSNDSIIFDSRGMSTNISAGRTYVFTRNGVKDSICVSRLGLIARKCGQ